MTGTLYVNKIKVNHYKDLMI